MGSTCRESTQTPGNKLLHYTTIYRIHLSVVDFFSVRLVTCDRPEFTVKWNLQHEHSRNVTGETLVTCFHSLFPGILDLSSHDSVLHTSSICFAGWTWGHSSSHPDISNIWFHSLYFALSWLESNMSYWVNVKTTNLWFHHFYWSKDHFHTAIFHMRPLGGM